MLIIVSYDITDDKRRNAVAAELKNVGQRVQRSVFECYIESEVLEELKKRLELMINIAEDHVRFYRLCEKDRPRVEVAGTGCIYRDEDYFRFIRLKRT